MGGAAIVLDNPILMKHVRSRLRGSQVVSWIVVVVVLSMCITWAGFAIPGFDHSGALWALLGLQALTLAIGGSQQVAAAVGGARASGILDFHRVSPLPPSWVALGFFLGAPAREYLTAACTLPFAVLCAYLSPLGVLGLIAMEVPLLFAAWILHALALLSSLVMRNPRGTTRGVPGLVLLILFLNGASSALFALRRAGVGLEDAHFFGVAVPWLVFLLLYQVPLLVFLLVAGSRKMEAERAHAYSKPQAVACLAIATTLILGGFWDVKGAQYLVVGLLYGLVTLGSLLLLTVTPDSAEYLKGVRRAVRLGGRRPGAWSDAGINRQVVIVLCAIVLVGATVAWEVIEGRPDLGRGHYSQTIAIGVLVVAYFGLALQFFELRAGRAGRTMMLLFLFLAWIVPLVVGVIGLAALENSNIAQAILALSPICGIAMSAGAAEAQVADVARFAALIPALGFTFVFNSLVVNTRRRIDRAVQKASDRRAGDKVEPVADPLA
jgi:hypothetical protein